MTRVRVDAVLAMGETVTLEGDQARHLTVVLRMAVGGEVEMVDGDGARWVGRVVATAPLRLEVVGARDGASADPAAHLEVWLPLLKGGKTDDLVRQLTELGAAQIVCFVATRSVARLVPLKVPKRLARWETIATEATRQCGRVSVPTIRFVSGLPTAGPGVYLWEEGGEPAHVALLAAGAGGTLRVLTGPEGGLDPADATALDACGWVAASLGSRILRAETASIAAATLALTALGEQGYGASSS